MINIIEITNVLTEVILEIFEKEKIKYDVIMALVEEDGIFLIQFVLLDRKRKIKNIFFIVIAGQDVEAFTTLEEAQAYFKKKVQEKRAVFEKVPNFLPR